MKQFWLQLIALMLVILGALWVSFTPGLVEKLVGKNISGSVGKLNIGQSKTPENLVVIVSNDGKQEKARLSIEIADNVEKRSKGLSGRTSLDKNTGMLFTGFEKENKLTFWMKGMLIPLDIIWISGDEIVGMEAVVPNPEPNTPDSELRTYMPNSQGVDKVLEVNAGYIREHNLTPGDKLRKVE